jgi:phenylacetaldehyde dehydrogenase
MGMSREIRAISSNRRSWPKPTATCAWSARRSSAPVVCVQSFDDDNLEAVAKFANDTEYGLQASVWTQNLKTAHMMARKIKAGTICINNHSYGDPAWPFGGYKQSGRGREMGKEVMEHYTETKSVAAKL